MTTLNIWFNQTYSTHYHTVRAVKESSRNAGVNTVIHTTSDNPLSPVLQAGDIAGLEPDRSITSGHEYVEWALAKVKEDKIDVLIPTREAFLIATYRKAFRDAGCEVIADSPDNIALMEDKELAYLHAEKVGVATPPWRVVSTAPQFHEAMESLDAEIEERFNTRLTICIKPVEGVGGVGFKRIVRSGSKYDFSTLISGATDYVRYGDLSEAIDAAGNLGARYMLMPWLDNPEVSVDTLSIDGEVKIIIPRAKKTWLEKTLGGPETVDSVSMTKTLVKSLNMSHLSNTQTRELMGETVYLETNARMSGGIPVSGLLGVDMCWEAIRSAMTGQCEVFEAPVEPVLYTMVPSPSLAGYKTGKTL